MHLPRLIDSCLLFPTSSSCYHHHYHGKHFFLKHSQTSKPSIEHFQIQPRITKGLGNTKQWQTIECKQRGFITVCYTRPYHIFDTAVFFHQKCPWMCHGWCAMDVPWMCHGCNNLAGHCCPLAHEYQTRVFHENVATDLVRMSRWPSQTIWLRSNSWKMTNWCRPMRRLYICTAAAVFISWTRVHYTTRLVAWNFSKWKRNASCQIDNHRRQMSVTGRKTESMQQTSTHKSIWLNISHRTASVSLTVLQPAKYFACL